MKKTIITGMIAAAVLVVGCDKKSSNGNSAPQAQTGATAASAPAAQPALTAWLQGDKAAAVSNLLAADWSARPLFEAGSTLNLSEAQYEALSNAQRETTSKDMLAQLVSLKALARELASAGQDAASKGDPAQARKCFTSLREFGIALSGPEYTQLVQLVGKAFVKLADAQLTKSGQ